MTLNFACTCTYQEQILSTCLNHKLRNSEILKYGKPKNHILRYNDFTCYNLLIMIHHVSIYLYAFPSLSQPSHQPVVLNSL